MYFEAYDKNWYLNLISDWNKDKDIDAFWEGVKEILKFVDDSVIVKHEGQ